MTKLSVFFCRAAAWFLSLMITIGLPVHLRRDEMTVTAHSGCMDLVDNSIEAMEAGVAAGADIVEFDLNFTENGDPVLSHDAPKEGETYVSLADAFRFLSEHKSVRANVDVKSLEHPEKMLSLAAEFGVTEQIFMTGLDENSISIVREKCPGVPYYLNASVTEDTDVRALVEKTLELGAVGLNINRKDVSPKLARLCHRSGLLLSVWTVNEEQQIIETALMGADNITTRRPDIVCAIIK